MKKLLSLALTLLMMISAFVIPCTTAQAKAVKKKPNTYVASEAFYNTSNGVFYSDGMNIMIKNKDGETLSKMGTLGKPEKIFVKRKNE